MNPWLLALVPPILLGVFGAIVPFVRWLVKTTVTGKLEKLATEIAANDKKQTDALALFDAKHSTSNKEQGTRIGDLESWNVAHEAVEEERRRVREDTRGIPVTEKRSRER